MSLKLARSIVPLVSFLVVSSSLGLPSALASSGPSMEKRPDGATVVHFTQTPCLFLESEEDPRAYASTRKEDCVAINTQTTGQRKLTTLKLKPGKYIFRVTNKNVPYELGFWLRGQGVGRVTLPSVSGGGLVTGKTKDYEITLREGSYYYSCPLNPTPDYTLLVE